ncbi:MAG TPA: LysE family transporter [Cellulomonas sp.]
MTAALLAGVVAGLGVAMPVGAITTLIALLSAQRGWRVGAAAGLGAATVDGVYATVALFFGALVAPLLVAWRAPLHWVAAGVLVVIAVRLLRPAWRPPADDATAPEGAEGGNAARPGTTPAQATGTAPPATGPSRTATATRPARAYLTFLGLTAVNPTTVVYFAALTTGGSAAGAVTSATNGAAFVVGAFAASAAWQLVIAGAGHGAGKALTGPRGRRWTAIVGGAIVVVLAVRTALGI